MRWIQVKVLIYECMDEEHYQTKELHTIKVDENCEDLKSECIKVLKSKNIKFDKIKSYKFI